jgi:YesN/AraC family two-component response regulator
MTISVVIVDDEPLAREGVALHLQDDCPTET